MVFNVVGICYYGFIWCCVFDWLLVMGCFQICDGYVVFNVFDDYYFDNFCEFFGWFDWCVGDDWFDMVYCVNYLFEIVLFIDVWVVEQLCDDFYYCVVCFGIFVGLIYDVQDVLDFFQFVVCDYFVMMVYFEVGVVCVVGWFY